MCSGEECGFVQFFLSRFCTVSVVVCICVQLCEVVCNCVQFRYMQLCSMSWSSVAGVGHGCDSAV